MRQNLGNMASIYSPANGNMPSRPSLNPSAISPQTATPSSGSQAVRPAQPSAPVVTRRFLRPLTAPPVTPIEVQKIPVDRAITARQVAVILGVSIKTLKKWRQRPGKGPRFMKYPDGAIRYRLSTVMAFLEASAVDR
jgi:DNA-binding transcriptional regulator YiaG